MNPVAIDSWSLRLVILVFALAALVIGVAGTRLSRLADRLADMTGLGEAIFGALLLGGTTSLPGIVASVTAAAGGYAELAVSNAIGGIAAQTMFLALADLVYRKANLEHAAASVENMLQGALLVVLLSLPMLASSGPEFTILAVHPVTLLIGVGYLFGLRIIGQARRTPYWRVSQTLETREDKPRESVQHGADLYRIWLAFACYGLVVAVAGYLVARTGIVIAERTGLSQTIVGGVLTAIVTSLPELVTSIAAVRQGALTLAVGGIIGGNTFDVLFLAFSDIAYREGSIYHAITGSQVFMISLTILLTGILVMGLLRREKHGIGNIGFESFLVLLFYFSAFALLFFM